MLRLYCPRERKNAFVLPFARAVVDECNDDFSRTTETRSLLPNQQRHAQCLHLATMGAIEYAPHHKILGNLLDLVLDSRRHEQQVA
jgi:hypothetical protein